MSAGQSDRADDTQDHSELTEVIAHKEDRDWFLSEVVRLANAGFDMGITIVVEGAVVSGILVSERKYFEDLGALIANASHENAVGSDLLTAVAEGWASNGLRYVKPDGSSDDWAPPEPNHIHLKNARIFAPGQGGMPNRGSVLWRGKINAVSGFSIGSLEYS
jgi:hypothetical protein